MVGRQSICHTFALLGLLFASAHAQDDDEACRVTLGAKKYDLNLVKGDHEAARTRETPPTAMVDTVRFNVCGELAALDGVDAADQCASGVRACLTKTNKKEGKSDRVVAVIAVGQTSDTDPKYEVLPSPHRGISVTMLGASYPSSDPIPQSFTLNLLCGTENSSPVLQSYNGSQVVVEMSSTAGCGFTAPGEPAGGDQGGDEGNEGQSVGSGIGWFFLALLLVFAGYFVLGAYYNYTTYGASGADLIPHRDFWREVPYMLRDVASHLCSSFQPRHSSRGGYIAV
ncbi:hypothetical protein FA95DRAFT_1543878 [Auriscalpium vulgare]|uniref:Uncharacterized protein n=1 Tax=Auriscalpium vulgare TaxID=40419 RepID=A0ACB8RN54_9AGAM|nr:hypothetical protein FA95DRAFT_1543878 [Auriscalpium vulgare]